MKGNKGRSQLVLLSPNFHEVRTNKSFALKLTHKFHLENDLISLKHPVHEGMPSSRNALIALARKYPRSRGSTLSLSFSPRFTFNYFRPCEYLSSLWVGWLHGNSLLPGRSFERRDSTFAENRLQPFLIDYRVDFDIHGNNRTLRVIVDVPQRPRKLLEIASSTSIHLFNTPRIIEIDRFFCYNEKRD